MGASGGPLSSVVTYDVGTGIVKVDARRRERGRTQESIFDYLSREMKRLRYLSDDLPFDFNCGFVGYFGYELKADCEGDDGASSRRCPTRRSSSPTGCSRSITTRSASTCSASPSRRPRRRAGAGSARPLPASRRCRRSSPWTSGRSPPAREPAEFRLSRSHEQYLDDIQTIKDYLTEGDTYEVCLTNKVHAPTSRPSRCRSTGRCATSTRRRSPPTCGSATRAVLSSSPERFLRDRPRRLGGGEADQGHAAARQGPRRGPAARARSCGRTRRTARRT